MKLIKYNPCCRSFDNSVVNSVFNNFFNDRFFHQPFSYWLGNWGPRTSLNEDGGFSLNYELAGYKPEDIKVEAEGDILYVMAENKKLGKLKHSVSLPDYVDVEKIDAKLENGLLEVVLPVKEEKKPKRIQIALK